MSYCRYKNKIVVITGATSGIGESIARMYSIEGAIVVLLGRNENKGLKLQKDIKNSIFYKCNVVNVDEIESIYNKIIFEFNGIDILVNNAGIMLDSKELDELDFEDWKKTFDINVNGIFNVTKVFIRSIVDRKGCIINNASIAGMHSYVVGKTYAYSASKAAVIQFTRQIALNYAVNGIRVNCICPGIVDTPILGNRNRETYAKRVPLGYIAKPEDIAKVVLFLSSDDAKYLTGVVLPIDGGLSL